MDKASNFFKMTVYCLGDNFSAQRRFVELVFVLNLTVPPRHGLSRSPDTTT